MAERKLNPTTGNLGRRELLAYSAAFGSSFLAAQGLLAQDHATPTEQVRSGRRAKPAAMKKSINMWAFPYPDTWSLKDLTEAVG